MQKAGVHKHDNFFAAGPRAYQPYYQSYHNQYQPLPNQQVASPMQAYHNYQQPTPVQSQQQLPPPPPPRMDAYHTQPAQYSGYNPYGGPPPRR